MRIEKTPDIPGEHTTMRTTDAYSSIIRSQLQPFGASAGSVAAGWEKEREGSHTARKQDERMWKKKESEKEVLSRRTSLPLLFLQSATPNWRPLLYILRIPAYNTLNATRDATLTKITLVTNYKLNRDEESFSREFTLRRSWKITYVAREVIFLRIVFFLFSFFFYFRSFHNPILFSFVRQSPGTPRANHQWVYRLGNRTL